MIDAEKLLAWKFDDVEHAYDETFSMLYALSIGIGADPLDPRQLQYVNETGGLPLAAFPAMVVVLGFPGSWMADRETGIDFSRIVHGEEEIFLFRDLPPAGRVVARHRVVSVEDKGEGRGAVIVYDKDLFNALDMGLIATVRHTTFARGDGGFSGKAVVRASGNRDAVAWDPQKSQTFRSLPQQGLFYRLCADRNPLHSDPETASRAGFEAPILHGLCTYGIASQAIVSQWAGFDGTRLKELRARFTSPVIPGDVLTIRSASDGDFIRFDVWNETRARVALSQGSARFK